MEEIQAPKKIGRPKATKEGFRFISQQTASKELGIPIPILKLMKIEYPEPFHPNYMDLKMVKAYYDKHKLELHNKLEEKNTKGTSALKDERISLQNENLRLKNAELKGQLVAMDELTAFLQTLGLKTGHILLQKLVTELPQRFDKVTADKRLDLCKDVYNEIVASLKANTENWIKDQEAKQTSINESITTKQSI